MNWLIVSTNKKNPGDEFIRIGIENVIRDVDPEATGRVIDKETQEIFNSVEFDKCVWAGMPVFWSLNENSNWNIPWWQPMTRGWLSDDKNKFCVLGAGSFQDWKDRYRGMQKDKMHEEAELLKSRSHVVTVRDSLACDITGVDFETIVCPAILSTINKTKTESIKGCNLMPGGAHYSQFNETESTIWNSKEREISRALLENDFHFFAHNEREFKHAKNLGWCDDHIISYTGNPHEMLSHYVNVDKFFGNRVHGCIVSRGTGADVISCGYDTRQEAVRLSGAEVLLPSEVDLNVIDNWAGEEPNINIFNLTDTKNTYHNILDHFMSV